MAFRLLDLPPELREYIFLFALSSAKPVAPRILVPRDAFVLRLPPLTQVSRQIRHEALPLYFESNTFEFNISDVLEPPLSLAQDLRFEKKLLTFGAWCEAAGIGRFERIRSFRLKGIKARVMIYVTVKLDRVEPEVLVEEVDMPAGAITKKTPRHLSELVKEAMKRNGGGLKPNDLVVLCRQINPLGASLMSGATS